MSELYINKVVVNGNVKIDLSGDTVEPKKMLSGTVAHDKTGAVIVGELLSRSIEDLEVTPAYIIIPPGVYPSGVLIDTSYTLAIEPNFEFPFSNESLTQNLINMGKVRNL